MSITKLAISCSIALAFAAAPAAQADQTVVPAKAKAAKHHKTTKTGKPVVKQTQEPSEDEPDTAGSVSTDFNCELGNKITIYKNAEDDTHIALRWKKRLHRLTRVGTTTGASRFENRSFGLIWIGIPSKGMLLDSKLNRQLANECKDAEQAKPAVLEAPVPVSAHDKQN
jgi:hypothetical protein